MEQNLAATEKLKRRPMTESPQDGHTGGCKCGAIRYRTAPHRGNAWICNCRFCQKMTGGPFLLEHCFVRSEVEIETGTPEVYVHISEGSGQEVHIHFCGTCGSGLFIAPRRWPEVFNIFTTSLDDPAEVGHGPETLGFLFLEMAQSGTVTPAGFAAFDAHADNADGSAPQRHVFDAPVVNAATDPGEGPHTGGCLCGEVRYEAEGEPFTVICHCRSCQKTLGTGVNHELLWPPEAFRVTQGEPKVVHETGGSGKGLAKRFCGTCGTALWLTGERFDEVGVFRGTLDHPNRIILSPDNAQQIFLDEALPSAMVLADIPACGQHVRAPDDSRNPSTIYARPWRVGDGPEG